MPVEQMQERHDRAAVARINGEYCVLTREAIPVGQAIFAIRGKLTDTPTKYSVQVGLDTHIELNDMDFEDMIDTCPWRFTNHSCDPNATIVDRRMVAIRDIAEWEQVTFNYNTTELSMAEPFQCHCGSVHCLRTIAGFRHLDAAERERLRPWLAPYLEKWLENGGN